MSLGTHKSWFTPLFANFPDACAAPLLGLFWMVISPEHIIGERGHISFTSLLPEGAGGKDACLTSNFQSAQNAKHHSIRQNTTNLQTKQKEKKTCFKIHTKNT